MLILQKHGIESDKVYRGTGTTPVWSSNNSGVTEQQLYDGATYKLEEIVSYFRVRLIHALQDGNQDLEFDISDGNATMFKEQRKKFGKCFTFDPESAEEEIEHGIYYVRIKL